MRSASGVTMIEAAPGRRRRRRRAARRTRRRRRGCRGANTSPSWSSATRPMNAALPAERRDADHRVGGRAARDLDRRAHRRVERVGALGVDERHRALARGPCSATNVVGLVAEHVDQRVADARRRRSRLTARRVVERCTATRRPSATGVARAVDRSARGRSGGGRSRRPTVLRAAVERGALLERAAERLDDRAEAPSRRAPGRGSRRRRGRCSRPSACRRGRCTRPAAPGGRRRRRSSPTTPARCRSSRGTRCARPRA